MRKFKWVVIPVVTLMAGALVACSGNTNNKEQKNATTEYVKEPSTRVPNSVVGKWYQYEDWDPNEVYIWEFEENGKYYSTYEDTYYQLGEDDIVSKYNYSLTDGNFILDGEVTTLEYTEYGLCITRESGSQTKLYEYRQDALESNPAYYTSDLYLEKQAEENGCVIVGDVLVKYYTNDSDIVIPDVKEIGGGCIESDLERIDSITVPGSVEKIGNGAFGELSVCNIYIEEGVKEIGSYAFSDCYFDELHIPASVESIGALVFSYEEANTDGKIYVKKGSYAEEFLKAEDFDGEVIVE